MTGLPRTWRPWLVSLLLFALNVWICRELFAIEFIRNLDTNEGAFISIARFFHDHFTDQRWYPWFNAGSPIENAYQPLLPMLAALTKSLSGWTIQRAFHFVLAVFYCAGPSALFWFAWDWTESVGIAFVAGLSWSLLSPAELLIPILRAEWQGHWVPLRLFNLIHYAEDPHIVSLTILPVALLFLRRTMAYRTVVYRTTLPGCAARNAVAAVLLCAAVVGTNAFGAVDLAIGALCIFAARRRGLVAAAVAGLAAYMLVSPWLPPSLVDLIRGDQWGARGQFHSGLAAAGAWTAAVAVSFAVFRIRAGSEFERCCALFGLWMCAIPMAFFLLDLTLVPQGSRYQLELEIAVCLCLACAFARIFALVRPYLERRPLVLAAAAALILAATVYQTRVVRRAARGMIQPVEIEHTIQYKTCMWLDRNLPGQRAMVSGDTEFLCNVFSDNPQLSSGHQPTAPNRMQQVAVYVIYTGTPPGRTEPEAEISLLWLRAFGIQAITVPGPNSREAHHPVSHPHRFDGILPVLWHDEDDTIFAVPELSPSLAHAIPKGAVVAREPIHGLDVAPLRPFVAALEDASLPPAQLVWKSPSKAVVRTAMTPDQALSVQVNYAPGWRAASRGRPVPIRRDGIGLMVLEPGCSGPCEVELEYGVTSEAWICRGFSAIAGLGLAGLLVRTRYRRRGEIGRFPVASL